MGETRPVMGRKARVEFAGAVYHVLDRGDRREAIFKDEADRRRFLETLGEVCARTGWRVHADVLMGNHDHLMIEGFHPQAISDETRMLQKLDDIHHNPVRHGWGGIARALAVVGGA